MIRGDKNNRERIMNQRPIVTFVTLRNVVFSKIAHVIGRRQALFAIHLFLRLESQVFPKNQQSEGRM
jgi:hypothetical protein